jgi:hypothetical protein
METRSVPVSFALVPVSFALTTSVPDASLISPITTNTTALGSISLAYTVSVPEPTSLLLAGLPIGISLLRSRRVSRA